MSRTTSTRHATTWIAGTALTALLAACSGGSTATSTLPAYTPSASTTTSATTGATSSASATLGYTPADPDGIGVVYTFTGITGDTERQEKIYGIWVRFHRAAARALNGSNQWKELSTTTDADLLRAIAHQVNQRETGKIGTHTTKGHFYSVGSAEVKLLSIDDTAKSATFTACINDQTYEVDKSGKVAIPAPGIFKIVEVATLKNGTWKFTRQLSAKAGECSM